MFIDRAGKFTYLPGSLLVLIVTGTFVQHIEFGAVVFDVSLSVTLLATSYATSQNRRSFVAGIVLAASTFTAA